MEERVGPITFFSNFDSGNLAKVERVKIDDDSSDKEDNSNPSFPVPDYEYNAWTWPDAVGTEYENLNRTWFHFGVKGGSPGRLLKINMMNLNRQGKLYSQGMSPFVKVVPGRNKWDRIRDRPTYETIDGQFRLSFTYRFPDQRNSVHYFAFCYPYSYAELQTRLDKLDKLYASCHHLTPASPSTSLYYYRELLCNTLDGLRVDLITLTSCKGMTEEREERLPSLFPDVETPRPHKFEGKKVFFLSARVHPGETPSSFVFEGFLDFLLRSDDPRAAVLRNQYVFKMVPMLNPDGVKRGHYRTDSRGVNLNRVYLEPEVSLHPTIHAAKSVILYHHNKREVPPFQCTCKKGRNNDNQKQSHSTDGEKLDNEMCSKERLPPDGMDSGGSSPAVDCTADDLTVVSAGSPDFDSSKGECERTLGDGDAKKNSTEKENKSSVEITNTENNGDIKNLSVKMNELSTAEENNNQLESAVTESKSEQIDDNKIEKTEHNSSNADSDKACEVCTCVPDAEASKGMLEYYVDLHGHASKRGCFVYANYMEDEGSYVNSILYPKLASLNSANFDFTGCNFTEKNMYTKDKRDGMSKEGSGRVAVFKATSIVHSYTLECNYNAGRMLNAVPPATCDSGRATPPPAPGFPPKFTTEIFEEVGRAIAVAVLDMNNANPWTRLPLSEFGSLEGVRNWVRRFIKSAKNAPSVPKKLSRAAAKTSSIVAGATATTRQKIGSTFKSSSSGDMSSDGLSAAAQKITERMTQNINASKEAAAKRNAEEAKPPKRIQALAMPRRLSQPVSGSPGRPTTDSSNKTGSSTNGGSLSDTSAVIGPIRSQLYKTKEQTRVSLDLPKTGPSLRISRPNQPLGSGIKALSCPADLRVGGNPVEIHNHLMMGLQPRMIPGARPGGGSASDDEKRKKSIVRKRNGRKKSQPDKSDETVQAIPSRPSDIRQPTRPRDVEPLGTGSTKKIPDVRRKGSGRPLLQRSNSKNKNTINRTARACEVVDITELPQNGSSAVAYWIDT